MNTPNFARNLVRRPRPARRQRGSVLILVVALLVLMALIGTAWISSSRVDRAATIQHASNTEVELLVDGVINMAKAAMVSDASGAGGPRMGNGYVSSDSTVTDKFLASRIPLLLDEVAPQWIATSPAPGLAYVDPYTYEPGRLVRVGGTSGDFYICLQEHRATTAETPGSSALWARVGSYDLGSNVPINMAAASTGAPLLNPVLWSATSDIRPPDTKFEDITGQVPDYTQRTNMMPTSVQVPPTTGKWFPGFRFFHTGLGRVVTVLAADTDGDGAADANFFRLPIGRVNGIDYFAAIRIVDNNSAINAAVASVDTNQTYPSPDQIATFPSDLNLLSLLMGPTLPRDVEEQANKLQHAVVDGTVDTRPVVYNGYQTPVSEYGRTNGPTRRDFAYPAPTQGGLSLLNWMQRGRRLANPGWWDKGGAPTLMKALPSTDAGALAYRGGTLINPDAMNLDAPLFTASSLVEQLLPQTIYFSADNHPASSGTNLNAGYRYDVGRRTSYPEDVPGAWLEMFIRNHDWMQRWTPPAERPSDPSTYRNRRALLTTWNPVSSAVPGKLMPRDADGNPSTVVPPWNPAVSYDVGDVVSDNDINWVCTSPIQAGSLVNGGQGGIRPGLAPVGVAFDHPNVVMPWEPRPYDQFSTRTSVNAGTFGQLYMAFWQVMAQNASLRRTERLGFEYGLPLYQTPFKDSYRAGLATALLDLDSPYYGGRFTAGVLGAGTQTFLPYVTPGANPPVADQHPLRGFRSPLRSVPATAAVSNTPPPFGAATPRLMTDHTMRLRAALAAVNAIDMRDSDDDVTVHEINLGVQLNRGSDAFNEFETVNWDRTGRSDQHVVARVKVYGHERQPFITEVYAENDTKTNGPPPANAAANPNGYVAIELYNPYDVPISIRHCKLATIDRTPGDVHVRNLTVMDPVLSPAQTPHLANAKSNMEPSPETDPWTIPAKGFLVLENYDAGNPPPAVTPAPPAAPAAVPPANFRPLATGILPSVGPIPALPYPPPAGRQPLKNFTYVPNLHTVMDKEVVLLRPLFADYPTATTTTLPPAPKLSGTVVPALRYVEPAILVTAGKTTPAVDMAPLDSYDFTGLPNPDPLVVADPTGTKTARLLNRAQAWHYSRGWQPQPGAADTEAWRFVYPGRYDGHQTLNQANALERRPRQQGTQVAGLTGATEAGWDPDSQQQNPWDPTSPNPLPTPLFPPITLADALVPPPSARSTYYPFEYAIQLTNSLGQMAGAAGPNPVVTGGSANMFPFGTFARNGDILQIPNIGSYRIKLTPWTMPPLRPAGGGVTGVATQVLPGENDPNNGNRTNQSSFYHRVLELNSISMDSVFAEDSDPYNHYGITTPTPDATLFAPEQVGRFAPSRLDLEESGGGTVGPAPSLTLANGTRPPNPALGTLNDPKRQEPGGTWANYEIEIVDGPGKGQVRLVTGYSAGGSFQVFPDWEVALQPGVSRYVLRRGPRWTFSDPAITPPGTFRTAGNKYWATSLLDYLTVDSPQDDYFPAADPSSFARFPASMTPPTAISTADPAQTPANTYGYMVSGGATAVTGSNNLVDQNGLYSYVDGYLQFITGPAAGEVRKIVGYNGSRREIGVAPAFNIAPLPGDRFRIIGKASEDRVGTQGLININTAPWPVLATIPWTRAADFPSGGDVLATNIEIAQAIAVYRDGDPSAGIAPHGPFRTLFDLYRVPRFFLHQRTMLVGMDPTGPNGDFMPAAGTPDNVRFDYEEQYLLLNRVSNMITTRSDSFTAYVLVQGWRGAGTANPELVVQRRRAFTADRSGLSPTNKDLAVQFFYND